MTLIDLIVITYFGLWPNSQSWEHLDTSQFGPYILGFLRAAVPASGRSLIPATSVELGFPHSKLLTNPVIYSYKVGLPWFTVLLEDCSLMVNARSGELCLSE